MTRSPLLLVPIAWFIVFGLSTSTAETLQGQRVELRDPELSTSAGSMSSTRFQLAISIGAPTASEVATGSNGTNLHPLTQRTIVPEPHSVSVTVYALILALSISARARRRRSAHHP